METEHGFRGEFYFLSNMYEYPCEYGRWAFPSSEHLYQWLKTEPGWWSEKIFNAPHGKVAKKLAANPKCPKVPIPEHHDWNSWRIHLMKIAMWHKFRNPHLRDMLIQTEHIRLVEYNHWNDTFWGVCKGKGENNLGKILMGLRTFLRENHCE